MQGDVCTLEEYKSLVKEWDMVVSEKMKEIWITGRSVGSEGVIGVVVDGFVEICMCLGISKAVSMELMMGIWEEVRMANEGFVMGILGESECDTPKKNGGEIGWKGSQIIVLGKGKHFLRRIEAEEVGVEVRVISKYVEGETGVGGSFQSVKMRKERVMGMIAGDLGEDRKVRMNEFGFEWRRVGGELRGKEMGILCINMPAVVLDGEFGREWAEKVYRRETFVSDYETRESDD